MVRDGLIYEIQSDKINTWEINTTDGMKTSTSGIDSHVFSLQFDLLYTPEATLFDTHYDGQGGDNQSPNECKDLAVAYTIKLGWIHVLLCTSS